MEHHEMVELIRGGVRDRAGAWADFGAGTGNFTRALAELLGPDGAVYAIDRDARAVAVQHQYASGNNAGALIYPRQHDFTQPLVLPPLDGALMANALHFVRDQPAVIAQVMGYVQPGGRLLVVEYDVIDVIRWVPYPLPFARLVALAQQLGLNKPELIGQRRSPSSGIVLYAAVVVKRIEV